MAATMAALRIASFLLLLLLLLPPRPRSAASAEPAPPPGPAAPPEPPAASRARAGRRPAPVTDVAKLCVCDLLVAQCDVNCCCDPDCSAADFSLFTACSVPIVTGDSDLCSQKAAIYSLDVEANPPERIFKLIDQINPNVFCIHAANYKQALSFISPEMPTSENFDQLLKQFGSATFSTEFDSWSINPDSPNSSYGVPVQTVDAFLRLPSPVVSSWCSDANPAVLVRHLKFTNIIIHKMAKMIIHNIQKWHEFVFQVNITVQSIVVRSLNGIRTLLDSKVLRLPTILDELCINIVLGVSYHITYTEAGEIIEAAASFVLGAITKEALSIQQSFEISFTQVNTKPVPLSGSPGYVVGLPVRAGFRLKNFLSTNNKYGQLTILQSTSNQDCLAAEGARTPVLFGYNMVSGCKLRITTAMECQLLTQTLLDLLKGQNFPEYVASFGNSQAQDVLDWVPITHLHTSEQVKSSCQIPVSLEIEVKWTKYGSLVNPQARIVNVTATLISLDKGRERTIPITSSVVFTDVSSPAEPGYRARPTINVKLPFDFFFPFV
uniref:Tectonic family member 1 n=1 Tax=Apteryx owenii TaxID=8824 RepID=A0A8B9QEA3_APTOW